VTAHSFSGNVAIAGIGATEFSKASGRSELSLATEAVNLALIDAGIEPSEVGGMVSYTADTNPDIDIARALGMGDLTFMSRIHYGGGAACAIVLQAAMAVASGVADVVVCYRAFNERSGHRFGTGVQDRPPMATAENAQFAWYSPVGLLTPASWAAMFAQRYMHATGTTSEALGWITMADRFHAATNPKAWFYEKPITMDDHQNSRFIVEPLRLLDCCQETDGGQALVITSLDRARDLPNAPAVIRAAAQGSGSGQDMMTSYYRDDMAHLPEMGLVAKQLWETSGLGPSDIQTAVLYDAFTPFVLFTIEEFGWCGWGEAKDFVKDGNIQIGGGLPINTHGGQLGEGYLHGVNGIAEGVRQVRGTGVNQVPNVEHVVVTAGTGVPTSGLILGVDR
jgi:acetyl-CoA acetyltransferase